MLDGQVCGCKGIRTCLACESDRSSVSNPSTPSKIRHYFCPVCRDLYHSDKRLVCGEHNAPQLSLKQITVVQDFCSVEEESSIIAEINRYPWKASQSGRQKQDFGPKVNFKKRKVTLGNFNGLPKFSERLYQQMVDTVKELNGFKPVEVCNLYYSPSTGASIDPHIDDNWLWGERLVTLSLSADTYLTMTHDDEPNAEVLIPMPRRSLLVLSGTARHNWKHSIKREHIVNDRIAVTFRELSPEFLAGGVNEEKGDFLLDVACNFNGTPLYREPVLNS